MHESAEIAALLAQLNHPSLPGIALGLERMRALLARLGHPERALPPVVHVAGTNGKGSTIAYLRAALEAAGLRVHVYTSPHLVHFRERIRLAGTLIGDAALLVSLARVQAAAESAPATFFEATTAAAFLAFATHPADVLLLETGMGGRLDATNLIDRPLLTVLTPISRDHQEFLGDTLAAIAHEKAGILKRGVPCVCAAQTGKAAEAIHTAAARAKAPVAMGGRDWQWWAEEETLQLRIEGRKWPIGLPRPSLAGTHQWPNAVLAAVCLLELQKTFPQITPAHIAQGIESARWPARLQRLSRLHPVCQALPIGSQAWLDGGHNEAAAQALADWLHQTAAGARKFHLFWGMLRSKDAAAFLAPLLPYLARVTALPLAADQDDHPPESLAALATKHGIAAQTEADAVHAAQRLHDQSTEEPVSVLIAGSLYLAGEVLALGDWPE